MLPDPSIFLSNATTFGLVTLRREATVEGSSLKAPCEGVKRVFIIKVLYHHQVPKARVLAAKSKDIYAKVLQQNLHTQPSRQRQVAEDQRRISLHSALDTTSTDSDLDSNSQPATELCERLRLELIS